MAAKQKQTSRVPWFVGLGLVGVVAIAGISMTACNKGGNPVSVSPVPVETASVSQSLEAYRGKVVILDIWATWCGPCRMEIPDFIKLQDKYRDEGLEIVGVSIDPIAQQGGGAPAVAPFMRKYRINYSIWMVNTAAALGPYMPSGGSIPTTFVLDRDGRTVRTLVGAKPASVFENEIKQLL
ncbi:MAG TPA: TlpA disulfide reductase family protein [Blastocatellia bacterium]|nr:TlpA disulfide reductase family protein [Blastocatellia bacterium]